MVKIEYIIEWFGMKNEKHQTLTLFVENPSFYFCYLEDFSYFFSYLASQWLLFANEFFKIKEVSFRDEYDH